MVSKRQVRKEVGMKLREKDDENEAFNDESSPPPRHGVSNC